MKLQLQSVTKTFGPVIANDAITLDVSGGEIHCLLGENGAGKSTLMNVLYGLITPDSGRILVDDVPLDLRGPGDAMAAGIGMVHQHFMLIPVLTVAENVMLGHEPSRFGGILDLDAARSLVREIGARFGFDVDPDAAVSSLPVGAQQQVEIIKALSRDARILVFDEPTAVLTPQETDELMRIMRELRAGGAGIIFITHKLREVREIADRITVIRRGRVVGEAEPGSSDRELASLMVGREVQLTVDRTPFTGGDVVLTVGDLTVHDAAGVATVNGVGFEVRSGEILGIAGVQGNGQNELVETLLGLRSATSGSARLEEHDLLTHSVRENLAAGIGFVPEDRKADGLVAAFSIAENMALDRTFEPPFVRRGLVDRRALADASDEAIEEFDIRASGRDVQAGTLSGGNQQKVVLARELRRDLRLFIASQPTRGIDVGSIEFVHTRIVAARDAGVAVIVVSTELDEILALSDRILVLSHGRVAGIAPAGASRADLGALMAGAEHDPETP